MNIKEVKGTAFKKALGCKSASFRWHNKNKSGGNFGFEIRGFRGHDLEINGYYGCDGSISQVRFGRVFWPDCTLTCKTFDSLIEQIKLVKEKVSE